MGQQELVFQPPESQKKILSAIFLLTFSLYIVPKCIQPCECTLIYFISLLVQPDTQLHYNKRACYFMNELESKSMFLLTFPTQKLMLES